MRLQWAAMMWAVGLGCGGTGAAASPDASSAPASGSRDEGFGQGGVVRLSVPGLNTCGATAGVVQADGHILVAGMAEDLDGHIGLYIVRLSSDGIIDTEFGVDGVVTHFVDGRQFDPFDLVEMPDGRLLVTGVVGGLPDEVVLLRLQPDGSLDPDFGTAGLSTATFGETAQGRELELLPDGSIMALVWVTNGTSVIRFLADGSVDPSFWPGDVPSMPEFVAEELELDPAGNLVVTGTVDESLSNLGVTTIGADGAMLSQLSFDIRADTQVVGHIIAADGSLLVGLVGAEGLESMRLSRNGDPLGGDTVSLSGMPAGRPGATAKSGDSLLMATLAAWPPGIALARFDIDGADDSFGSDGRVLFFHPDDDLEAYVGDLMVQTDRRIVLVGTAWDPLAPRCENFLARFHP